MHSTTDHFTDGVGRPVAWASNSTGCPTSATILLGSIKNHGFLAASCWLITGHSFSATHSNNKLHFYKQEAQLPPRNRASAMHLFIAKLRSIAVMTYTYVYHLRNLGPMIGLICYAHCHTANKLQHATAARAHDARYHCHLMLPV